MALPFIRSFPLAIFISFPYNNTMKNLALDYLNKDYCLNIDMIELLKRDECLLVDADDHYVILSDRHQYTYLVSSDSDEGYRRFLELQLSPELLVIHQERGLALLMEPLQMMIDMTCYNAYYPFQAVTEAATPLTFKPLKSSDLAIVTAHYKSTSPEYLEERLHLGKIQGGYLDNSLVGFIGEHEEGSMGMLEIFESYRKKGFATAFVRHAIKHYLDRGQVPYSQIEISNQPSIALHHKLQMNLSASFVYWCSRRKD